MPIVQWSDDFKTGVCGVDCQHKALVRMLSGLYAIAEKAQDREVAAEATSLLADFVVEHFQCEEKTMRDAGYPGYESHKKGHDEFAGEVVKIVQHFDETGDNGALATSVQHYMVPWLTGHFTKADREMAHFITGGPGGKAA
ncbi:MAG: hemerythrin family protein [Actinobacteria bacterium]|nr:hemerythrin family protein [Actinomycetota bacterium]